MKLKAENVWTFTTGAAILNLAATAWLVGCGGSSISTESSNGGSGATTHTVNLSWVASTSADVSGYIVYRAVYTTSCGTFVRINSELITSTRYTDSQVTAGASYCYATTAVNTINEESVYSNIVSNIKIPAS